MEQGLRVFVFLTSLQNEKWRSRNSYPCLTITVTLQKDSSNTGLWSWKTDAFYDKFKLNEYFSFPKIKCKN